MTATPSGPEQPGSQPANGSTPSTGDGPVPGSGDAAVQAAAERAEHTRSRNAPEFEDVPGTPDTANLRLGPGLHDKCLPLLPLVGVWRGTGEAIETNGAEYRFLEEIVFSHDGRDFLRCDARAWRLDNEDNVSDSAFREVSWWRPGQDESIEVLVAHHDGIAELLFGKPRSQTSWELTSDAVMRSPSAEPVTASQRLYGIVDGDLAYVEERVTGENTQPKPRVSAKLQRVAG